MSCPWADHDTQKVLECAIPRCHRVAGYMCVSTGPRPGQVFVGVRVILSKIPLLGIPLEKPTLTPVQPVFVIL